MMKNAFLIIGFLLWINDIYCQKRWSFELHGGIAENAKLPLIIKQKGYPDIRIKKADFYSEPLNDPFYWDWRFSRWVKGKSIEFEAIHHKLYLKNLPPEVERFGISHGFNMLTLNHGREWKKIIFRGGLGSVLIHPESTVRGMKYPETGGFDLPGYRLRGITMGLAVAKQINFGKNFYINTEAKINASAVNSPIVDGYARVYNIAFQLILGPGLNGFLRDEVKTE